MSERPILIKGARLIDPVDGFEAIGDLLLVDGAIAARGRVDGTPDGALVIDGAGLVAAPGFIDLHAHLREPGYEDKETIATGAAAAARGGFTTLCCMPNTSPALDNVAIVEYVLAKAREAGPIRVLPIGAVSVGRGGKQLTDMEDLARAGCVAFSDDGAVVATGHLMQMALLYAGQLGAPVIDHREDPAIAAGLGVHDGWAASRLGLAGVPTASEESIVARDIALAELTGGHFHVAHLSTAGSVELVRQAKARGLRVTAEVTPHHLTLDEAWVLGERGVTPSALSLDAYETRAKVSPPLRAIADREAVAAALRDGAIDCVATDHAPHTFSDKAVPFEEAAVGISNLETAFGSLMTLVHRKELDLSILIHRLTAGPATVLGQAYAGLASLREGTPADVVLFDPNEEWTVDAKTFASKGKNTPLDGSTLKGRIKLTIAQGQIAYDGVGGSSIVH